MCGGPRAPHAFAKAPDGFIYNLNNNKKNIIKTIGISKNLLIKMCQIKNILANRMTE